MASLKTKKISVVCSKYNIAKAVVFGKVKFKETGGFRGMFFHCQGL